MGSLLRVALADHHLLFVEALKYNLQSAENLNVTFTATSGSELLELLKDNPVDVLLLEVNLPGISGYDCLEIIRKNYPLVKPVILSMYDNPEVIMKSIGHGARGYLYKDIKLDLLMNVIFLVHKYGFFYTENVSRIIQGDLSQIKSSSPITRKYGFSLSNTELVIIQLTCQEKKSKEIANELNLSERTIETYRNKLIKKIGCKSIPGLVLFAVKNNLIYY